MHESHFLGVKCVGCMLGMVALLAASIIAVHHLIITPMPNFSRCVLFRTMGYNVGARDALPMLPMLFVESCRTMQNQQKTRNSWPAVKENPHHALMLRKGSRHQSARGKACEAPPTHDMVSSHSNQAVWCTCCKHCKQVKDGRTALAVPTKNGWLTLRAREGTALISTSHGR